MSEHQINAIPGGLRNLRIVSLQLVQTARNSLLGSSHDEWLSADGIGICLCPARCYARTDRSCRFDVVVAAAQRHSGIALGVWRVRDGAQRLEVNPGRSAGWSLDDGDRVVVMALQVYA